MKPVTESDKVSARAWYEEHRAHVDRMLAADTSPAYPPCGSDCIRPELWKPSHWKWLLDADLPTAKELLNESADLLERAIAFQQQVGRDTEALECLVDGHRRWALEEKPEDQRGCLCNSQGILHTAAEVIRKLNTTEEEEQERLAALLDEQVEKTRTGIQMAFYRPKNQQPKRGLPILLWVVFAVSIVLAWLITSALL